MRRRALARGRGTIRIRMETLVVAAALSEFATMNTKSILFSPRLRNAVGNFVGSLDGSLYDSDASRGTEAVRPCGGPVCVALRVERSDDVRAPSATASPHLAKIASKFRLLLIGSGYVIRCDSSIGRYYRLRRKEGAPHEP
jgi:hypothetical protein